MTLRKRDEDRKLVKRAQKGDQEAISTLYRKYLGPIYAFVYAKTGNKQDAEDITQDVFLRAFSAVEGFKFKASFKNWLYQIAKNSVAESWRKKYKTPTVPLEEFLQLSMKEEAAPEGPTPEQAKLLTKILDLLPERYKAVLEYRFLKNLSIKETAKALALTEGNVKVIQYRALKKASALGDVLENETQLGSETA